MIAAGRRSNTSRTASAICRRHAALGAERLDHDRDRMGDADRVGHLHLAAIGEPGGDHVLRDPARGVRGGAVDLGRVLAREGAAAMARHAAVGVDDDLAPGQAAVAHRTADHEAARRVDEHEVAIAEPLDVDSSPGSTGSSTCSIRSAFSVACVVLLGVLRGDRAGG